MSKSSKATREMMRNRRLPVPIDPEKALTSRKPEKICLTVAAVLTAIFFLFMWFTGSAVMYVHLWVYLAAISAIVLALLAAGALAIYRNLTTDRARRNGSITLIGLMVMFVTLAIVLCTSASIVERPVAFYDSPEQENTIVVMSTSAEQGVLITAYPAIGRNFYVAGLKSEIVHSNGIIQGVEWEGERLAKVILCDINGNDTALTVDFSLLYAEDDTAAE